MNIYIVIDTSSESQIYLALYDAEKKLSESTTEAGHEFSEKLLPAIDSLFSNASESINNLSGVFVVHGPGRFSALRTGITTANILGWSLNIPVAAIENGGVSEEEIIKQISSLKETKFSGPIAPEYGRDPSVTRRK